jgi:hypothetical protein
LALTSPTTERERERDKVGGGSEKHYNRGEGSETIIFDLKVPKHCPLVLLIRVRLEFRVNSTFFLYIYIYIYIIVMLLELEGLHWSEI